MGIIGILFQPAVATSPWVATEKYRGILTVGRSQRPLRQSFQPIFIEKRRDVLRVRSRQLAALAVAPCGATGCSHGWSAVRRKANVAQPVEVGAALSICPGGAEGLRCAPLPVPSPLPGRIENHANPIPRVSRRRASASPTLHPWLHSFAPLERIAVPSPRWGESKIMRTLSHGFRVGGLSPRRRCTRGYIPSPLGGESPICRYIPSPLPGRIANLPPRRGG
jgi:hypothetical protein